MKYTHKNNCINLIISCLSVNNDINCNKIFCGINVIVNFIFLYFIFRRVNSTDLFLKYETIVSSAGVHIFRWITASNFKIFIKNCNSFKLRKENMAISILDNHESHISKDSLNMTKFNSTFTLTPHTVAPSLDRAVYGPFVKYYNTAANDCLHSRIIGSISIYYLMFKLYVNLPSGNM